MANRRLLINIPIWVRVSVIITLVLVGVVVSSMLVGGSSLGGHETGRMGGMAAMDHNGGQTGQAARSESEPPDCLRDH